MNPSTHLVLLIVANENGQMRYEHTPINKVGVLSVRSLELTGTRISLWCDTICKHVVSTRGVLIMIFIEIFAILNFSHHSTTVQPSETNKPVYYPMCDLKQQINNIPYDDINKTHAQSKHIP